MSAHPSPELMHPDPPRKLLIVRLSAIGDVVMAMPLLPMLHRHWPTTRISWLVQGECAPLLTGHPDLDEVIELPRARWRQLRAGRNWLTLAREITGMMHQLRKRNFDMAIDIQGLLKSAVWVRASAAPTRIGLDSREHSAGLMTRVVHSPRDDARMGSEYRHLAATLGLPGEFSGGLHVSDAARQRARELTAALAPYVVLCPFTTRPQKHWIDDHWTELGAALARAGLTPVVLGGPGDATAADSLCARAPSLVNLSGRTTLPEAAAIVAGAAALVGVDTGLTHMASALRVPAVALFGSTRPYLDAGTVTTRVMYHQLPCSPCRRRPTCDGRYDCMRAHNPEDVMTVLDRLGALA